jgi:uridylate kinase
MEVEKVAIISLGGSLIIPNGGIDIEFLGEFANFLRKKIASGWRFFIVVGGGSTARHYIEAAKNISGEITEWDLDWLGIHTTRLNAHLVRTIFRDIAHPRVIANYEKKIEDLKEPLVVASGWKPGCSTDYDAVYLANMYGAKEIYNLSNISMVYDKDPRQHPDAKPLKKLTWEEMEKLVGTVWRSGMNVPFDPIASKYARENHFRVKILNGKDLENFEDALEGREFIGTVIE